MSNIVWQQHQIDRTTREAQKQQQAVVRWFTRLSGAGKSTAANALGQAVVGVGGIFGIRPRRDLVGLEYDSIREAFS